jgi:DNA / pantothenate metabolism flavoprotein
VSFQSVQDYLFLLRSATQELSTMGRSVIIYLAAAVSDFYIPCAEMAQHKIQSHGKDGMSVKLHNVPKMLGYVAQRWAPEAYVISFKVCGVMMPPGFLTTQCATRLYVSAHHCVCVFFFFFACTCSFVCVCVCVWVCVYVCMYMCGGGGGGWVSPMVNVESHRVWFPLPIIMFFLAVFSWKPIKPFLNRK